MAPRGQPLAADVVAKMKKLRAAGHTIPEVAAELSLSKSTVSRYMSRDDGGSEMEEEAPTETEAPAPKVTGQRAKIEELESNLSWYADREKELLDLNSVLAGELAHALQKVRALEAAT